jgi:hypothetical protein
MSDRTLERVGAATGIAFAALAVASTVVVPSAPDVDAGAGEIRSYLVSHQHALGVSTVLMAFAGVAIIGFFAAVHGRLRSGERSGSWLPGAFGVAGTIVAGAALLGAVFEAVLVQQVAPGADDSTLRAFYVTWLFVSHGGPSLAMTPALVVAAVVTLRSGAFARWLAIPALASAALALVSDVADLASSGGSSDALGLTAFGLVLIWIVATSVVMLAARRVAPASAGPAVALP